MLAGAGAGGHSPADEPSPTRAGELAELAGLVGEEKACAFAVFSGLQEGDAGQASGLFLGADPDREHRTRVHRFFKGIRTLGGPFETETTAAVEGAPAGVLVRHAGARGQKRGRGEAGGRLGWGRQDAWPGVQGSRYCRFTLHKSNVDTSAAVASLARAVGVKHSHFSFAGTKDKRGVTLQRCAVHRVSAERLGKTNGRITGVRVGDFEYAREPLFLGDLQGNHFTITLRNVQGSRKDVNAALTELRKTGFVNYFGLQRFGHGESPTHAVGVALLRGRWEDAARLILTSYAREGPIAEACAQFLEDWDAGALLKVLPRRMTSERALAEGVRRVGKDRLVESLQSIPRHTRSMYLHAYQSFLWNHAASERISRLSMTHAAEGDLVLCEGGEGAEGESGVACEHGSAANTQFRKRSLPEVRHVTKEEAEAQAVSIGRVVLPLPGTMVTYPKNASADVFREMAAEDDVDLEAAQHREREFSLSSLSGAYRKLVHVPGDLEWDFIRYEDDAADLLQTDIELLKKAESAAKNEANTIGYGPENEGSKLALRFQVTLPPSCYATMLIREMLKTSTSAAFHAALNGGGGPNVPGGAPHKETEAPRPVGPATSDVAGFRAELAQLLQVHRTSPRVLVIFNAGPGHPSESWCPDCRRALPLAENMAAETRLIKVLRVDVGGRDAWKDAAHPLRTAPDLQLSCVPTLMWASAGGFGDALGPELEACESEQDVRDRLAPFLGARGAPPEPPPQ